MKTVGKNWLEHLSDSFLAVCCRICDNCYNILKLDANISDSLNNCLAESRMVAGWHGACINEVVTASDPCDDIKDTMITDICCLISDYGHFGAFYKILQSVP